jgi:MFS family permease
VGGEPRPDPESAQRPVGFVPLWAHAAALGVVLVLLAPLSRPVDLWTADEGAVRLQVEALAEHGTWSLPRPLIELDPDGVTVPIHDAAIVGDRYVPFSKQPASPTIMAWFQAPLGRAWAIAPSLVSVIVAAYLTGRLAGRFGRGNGPLALWTVGLFSPMFLYGFTVLGHTAATAVAAGLLVAVTAAMSGSRVMWFVALAASLAGPLLRSEAVIFAGAVSAVVVVSAIRSRRRASAIWGAACGGAAIAGLGLNLFLQVLIGDDVATTVAGGEAGFIDRVASGIFDATVRPDADATVTAVLLVFAIAVLGLLVVSLRRDPARWPVHVALAAIAVAAAVGTIWLATPIVWGIFVAMPVLVFGLASIDRRMLADPNARFLLSVSVLYAAGVFITQVEGAGGHQWGGRYLMLLLPAIVPVVVAAAVATVGSSARWSRAAAVTAVVVVALVCTGLSWRALRDVRLASSLLSETIGEALEEAGDAGDGDGPVLVSSVVQIGRQGWRHVIDNRFVMVPEDDLPGYVDEVAASPLSTLVVVDAYDRRDDALFSEAGFEVAPGPESPVPVVDFSIASR